MMRSTSEGTWIWFQLDVDQKSKIEWPVELFMLYQKTSPTEAEMRCQLWDEGQISRMTERELREIKATVWRVNGNMGDWVTAKRISSAGRNDEHDGGLKVPKKAKEKGA